MKGSIQSKATYIIMKRRIKVQVQVYFTLFTGKLIDIQVVYSNAEIKIQTEISQRKKQHLIVYSDQSSQ